MSRLPDRKTVKAALRALGLSNRQTRALLEHGWTALVDESEAEVEELKALHSLLHGDSGGERV